MKTAIIYYSYDGNCAFAAQIMKDATKADVFEIKTVDSKRRNGFLKIVWGGMQVVLKKKPAIHPLPVNTDAYDLVVLGTPVWAGSPAPAMVSFLDGKKITGKKIALFCCHGGGKGTIFEKFRALLPGNNFVGELDLQQPARKERAVSEQLIKDWVKKLGF